jgi:hypothetical protein
MAEIARRLKFERKPSPVLAEHRPLYKISQVLLILRFASRGGKSSLARLHLFNWAMKRPDRLQRLVEAAESKALRVTAWGFDPALAIALRYSIAEGLVRTVSTGYQITDTGEVLADAVLKSADIFVSEKPLLKAIGKDITEGMIEDVAKGWESA